MVAKETEDWKEAKRNYWKALNIKQEFNDRFSQASTYFQLGNVAQEEQDWEEAKKNYREALKIEWEFNDLFSQADTYHELGIVAWAEKDNPSALWYFALALDIYSDYNNNHNIEKAIISLTFLLTSWDGDAKEAIERVEAGEETKMVMRKILEEIGKK